MLANEKVMDSDYIIAFRNILKEAERRDKEAMDRFRSWTAGSMDPSEEEPYTNAVKECAGKLKKDRISA